MRNKDFSHYYSSQETGYRKAWKQTSFTRLFGELCRLATDLGKEQLLFYSGLILASR